MNDIVSGGPAVASHADLEHLLAFAHGEMSGAEADAVLQHGRGCRACGDRLAVMLALAGRASLTAGESPEAVEEPAEKDEGDHEPAGVSSLSWLPAIAALIVVALTVGATLTSWWPTGGGGSAPVVSGADADGGGTPPLDAAAARLRRLATAVPPDSVVVDFLFGREVPAAARQQARSGLALVADGRYTEAVEQLGPVYAAAPDDGEAAAALGMALYLSGDDGGRAEALLRQGAALRLQDFSRLSSWYLGNLYLRRGDVVQARAVLEPLTEVEEVDDGPARDARNLLERLRAEGQ